MNSLRNLPIVLRYEDDGNIIAQCPLLPDCQCKSTSRTQVLRTMQMLIKNTLAMSPSVKAQKYEVVHLAVASASDTGNRFGSRASRRKKTESPLLEVV